MQKYKALLSTVVVFGILSSPAIATTELNVAVAANSPPMLSKSPSGKIEGVEMDIFNAFCKKNDCTLRVKEYTFEGMLGALASGQADVAFSAISITPKREAVMDFSKPYYENSWNLVSMTSRNIKITDLSQLKKYKIGYPRGMAYSGLIKSKLQPKGYYQLSDVRLYPSYSETMQDLKNGNIDLAFVEDPVLIFYKNKKNYPIINSYSFKRMDSLGFAFKKNSPLRNQFNQFLDEEGQEKINVIVGKWMK
nr:transporter substrate-binding domain-containing protein [Edwardsiella ictaluri]